jgi:glycerate kinase
MPDLLAGAAAIRHPAGMRVLMVPDKFKGTLTAREAAEAIADGWRSIRREDDIELFPMSDGGDGFGEVMSQNSGAEVREIKTVNAAGEACVARWWLDRKGGSAIIESACVIGLAMLPPGKFHPFELDTGGLAAVVRAAAQEGASRCLIGIGGSATNDGGFGLARGLGWEFRDRRGQPIMAWTDLARAVAIIPPKRRRWFHSCTVAVDVQNRLLGQKGATRVYGAQKGLSPADFPAAEAALRKLARLVAKQSGRNYAAEPGTGAAGGLGFGLRAFLGAQLRPGFEIFARQACLKEHIRWADLVITGEGQMDASTLMGKGVGQVARYCAQLGVPCIGLGGHIKKTIGEFEGSFTWTLGTTDLADRDKALARPRYWLTRLGATAASRSPVA